ARAAHGATRTTRPRGRRRGAPPPRRAPGAGARRAPGHPPRSARARAPSAASTNAPPAGRDPSTHLPGLTLGEPANPLTRSTAATLGHQARHLAPMMPHGAPGGRPWSSAPPRLMQQMMHDDARDGARIGESA